MKYRKVASSPEEKNTELIQSIENTIKSSFPMSGTNSTLEIQNISTKITKPTYENIKSAISNKGSIMAKVFATLILKNKNGKVIDKDKIPIAMVPIVTKKGTFLIDGTSYNVISQQRLKPGVYTYKRGDGIVYTTFKPKNGKGFKMFLSADGKLKVSTSSKSFNADSILYGFGVSNSDIASVFGDEIAKKNSSPSKEEFDNFKNDVFYKDSENLSFDKDVLGTTIGVKSNTISKQMLIGSMKKLHDVIGGKKEEDEPTNMIFKTIHTAPDLISEQYKKALKDYVSNIRFKLNKGEYKKVKDIISGTNTFTKPLKSTIVMSKMSRIPDEYNPINSSMYNYLISPMGEGGVGDSRALSLDHKAIHHSQLGFIDPIFSPEGANVGITLAVTGNAYVDENGEPAMFVKNSKTGKKEMKTLKGLWDKKVAYPHSGKEKTSGIFAREGNNDIKIKGRKDSDYEILSVNSLHSPSTNFIPLINSSDANRTNMAQKHIQQALPLVNPDIPNVGVTSDTDGSTGRDSAKETNSAITSDIDGVVSSVTAHDITVKGKNGISKFDYATDLPFSTKTFLSHTPSVKKGDSIKKGQLLADSNFTKNGEMAIGKNLNVAWLSMPGNRNDGVVISESASEKLTSVHMYKNTIPKTSDDVMDLKKALILFPSIMKKINPENYDSRGIVKIGVKLKKGEPMAIVLASNKHRDIKSKLSMEIQRPYRASLSLWKKSDEGEVIKTTVNGSNIVIETKVLSKAKVGDKLSARAGNKGIISRILPDDEMPHTKDGEAIDMTLTAAGVVSRINPGVIEEGALGRIAKSKGSEINIPHYGLENNFKEIKKAFGDTFKEQKQELINPETGKPFPSKVFVGNPYIIKLFKDSEGATASVGVGATDQNEQAVKGGKESASSISNMEVNALLAHGASNILQEVRDIKGQKNDDYFRAVMSGSHFTPNTKTPYAMDKFTALLEQFNVKVSKDEENGNFSTDQISSKDVVKNSSGEVKSAETINLKTKAPIKGGLFDEGTFGGVSGWKKGHIKLNTPIPNPLYEDEITTMLGITKKEFSQKIEDGKINDITRLISGINADEKIDELSASIDRDKSASSVNRKAKAIRLLKNSKRSGVSIKDSAIISAIPVIPPKFRPITIGKNEINMDGLNTLYRDIIDLSNASKHDKSGDVASDLYKSVGALYGTHKSPNPDINEENIQGVMGLIRGKNPKQSFAQKNLVRKKQFMSGRGVIRPSRNDIGIDEIELPEKLALNIYSPHISNALAKKGLDQEEIDSLIESKDDSVINELKSIMKKYPVYYTRSPALWKHNILGAKPRLVKGDTIGINQLTERSMGADFDGDAIAVYATSNAKSADDVFKKLLPSNHLFTEDTNMSTPDLLILPDQDSSLGIYKASLHSSKKAQKVPSIEELKRKIKSGDINYNDRVIL